MNSSNEDFFDLVDQSIEIIENHSRELFSFRKRDSYYKLYDLSALFLKNPSLHSLDIIQLEELCKSIVDFTEVTNDWSNWFVWASKIKQNKERVDPIIYYGMGRYYEEIEEYSYSHKFHRSGIYWAKKFGDEFGLAVNCLGIGIILSRIDNKKAITYLKISKKIFLKKRNLYYLGCTLSDMGGYYLRFDQPIKAILCFLFAIFIHKFKGYSWDLPRMVYSLASVFLTNKAIYTLSYPLLIWICNQYYNNQNDYEIRYLALAKYGLARFYYLSKRYELALSELDDAFNIYEPFYKKSGMYSENYLNILIMFAYANIRIGNVTLANQYLQKIEATILDEGKKGDKKILRRVHIYNAIIRLADKLDNQSTVIRWKEKRENL